MQPSDRVDGMNGIVRWTLWLLVAAAVLTAVGCARSAERPVGPGPTEAALAGEHMIATDGYELRLRRWLPEGQTDAVVLALHGFNDYAGAFDGLAEPLTQAGMAVYAYDQRGHGASGPRGVWPGRELLVDDAVTAIELLHERYPGHPVYLLGASMGGAVAMLALDRAPAPEVAGTVLLAPAVWGDEIMPWYQQFGLWLGEAVVPGMQLSAQLGQMLGKSPTDQDEVLQELRDDPLVQREARVDTLEGLSKLMDAGLEASARLHGPALILYGDRDEIIPAEPVCRMLGRLPGGDATPWRMALYPGGYHMLLRYSGAAQVRADIRAWLLDPDGALPSGHEVTRAEARSSLCD